MWTKNSLRGWLAIRIHTLFPGKQMPAQTWYVNSPYQLWLCSIWIAILAIRVATNFGLELHQTQRRCPLPPHFQYWSNPDGELEYHYHNIYHKRMDRRILLQFLVHLRQKSCKLLDQRENRKEVLRGDSGAPPCICRFGCHSGHSRHIAARPNGTARPWGIDSWVFKLIEIDLAPSYVDKPQACGDRDIFTRPDVSISTTWAKPQRLTNAS